MPLLFRKRGRRQDAVVAVTKAEGVSGAAAATATAAAATAIAAALTAAAKTASLQPAAPRVYDGDVGGGLVAVWDLPSISGDGADEAEGQPPAKVQIQERQQDTPSGDDGAAVAKAPAEPQSVAPTSAPAPFLAAPEPPGPTTTPTTAMEEQHTPEVQQASVLQRLVDELQRSEQAAQRAVLALRRDAARLEDEKGQLQAALDGCKTEHQRLQVLVEELAGAARRVQELEEAEQASGELIASLRGKVAQLELQQQYQQGYIMEVPFHHGYPMAYQPEYYPVHAVHSVGPEMVAMASPAPPPLPPQQVAVVPAAPLPPTPAAPASPSSSASGGAGGARPRGRRRVRQCYNCQRFGHDARDCGGVTTCLVCGRLGHSHKQCTSTHTECVNCNGEHRASYKECPVRLAHASAAPAN